MIRRSTVPIPAPTPIPILAVLERLPELEEVLDPPVGCEDSVTVVGGIVAVELGNVAVEPGRVDVCTAAVVLPDVVVTGGMSDF